MLLSQVPPTSALSPKTNQSECEMPVDVKIWDISSGDQLIEIKKGKLNLAG